MTLALAAHVVYNDASVATHNTLTGKTDTQKASNNAKIGIYKAASDAKIAVHEARAEIKKI